MTRAVLLSVILALGIGSCSAMKLSPLPSSTLELQDQVDCSQLVKPLDISPFRSPQAVHSFLAKHFRGKDIVELGTHKGDGMNCFARFAKSAVAIEANEQDCKDLKQRDGADKYNVHCGFFPDSFKDGVDGDIVTLWQSTPELSYKAVGETLARFQKRGVLRKSAEAVFLFDMTYGEDTDDYNNIYKNLATWEKRVDFDELEMSKNAGEGRDDYLSRTQGFFMVVGIPVSKFAGGIHV